jgi:DNA invertase Pin-like site-specific DNA recombinase
MPNLIAYYRVSTKRQGRSGLGLEAQQAAVAEYARQHKVRRFILTDRKARRLSRFD